MEIGLDLERTVVEQNTIIHFCWFSDRKSQKLLVLLR